MRIAFFTETYIPQVNGAVTSINAFTEELVKRGHSVDIFAPAPGSSSWDGARIYRFKSITFFPYPEFRAALPSSRVYELVKKNKYDVIQTHGPFALGYQGWKAGKKFKIPLFTTFHTPIADYIPYLVGGKHSPLVPLGKAIAWWYTRWYYNRFPVVFSPSNTIMDLLRNKGIKSRMELLRTGLKLEEFDRVKKDEQILERFGISRPYVIHSGRLSHEKNVDTVLNAFARIKDKYDIDLVITSRGPLFNKLKETANKLGLDGRVHFTGFIEREDQMRLFKNALFGIIASDADTQGLVVLEEMACGIPVIGANALALPESIIPGKTGLLFKVYDDRDLARKIAWMVENNRDRKKMGKNARKFAEENTIQVWTDRLIEYYSEPI